MVSKKKRRKPVRQKRGPGKPPSMAILMTAPRDPAARLKWEAARAPLLAPCGDPWCAHALEVCACWHRYDDCPCCYTAHVPAHLARGCPCPEAEWGDGHSRWYGGEDSGCPVPEGVDARTPADFMYWWD